MTSLESTRHNLIDRIIATKNEKFLKAITAIFDSSEAEEIVELSPEQVKMNNDGERRYRCRKAYF